MKKYIITGADKEAFVQSLGEIAGENNLYKTDAIVIRFRRGKKLSYGQIAELMKKTHKKIQIHKVK